ncbi:FlgD immunoglobulin-like domain containing protein [Candidatus Kapabacteria bacterium]|nr:FlgD immunoglobulin-like domain containing protein [Candidatus Kapabacteria bacterium]
MQRLTHLSIFAIILSIFGVSNASAADVIVSGTIKPNEVMVFLKDNDYIINKSLVVGGTLIIEPGTKVIFYPNGRLIDSTGGRIIADGFASATYTSNPDIVNPNTLDTNRLNPVGISGLSTNPNVPTSYNGYSDLNYFLHGQGNNHAYADGPVIDLTGTKADPTVNPFKYNDIFNVLLDTVSRSIKNLTYDDFGFIVPPVANREVIIPYQMAMMFLASKMDKDPAGDVNLRNFPWSRLGDKSVDIGAGDTEANEIQFIGQPATNFSRELGHIVVLPGARAAYFRNCSFEGMKKDTTVDRVPLFSETQANAFPWAVSNDTPDWDQINNDLRLASNGSGGAITTFSTRTWLLSCTFEDNISKFRGGAVQFLQAPKGFPMVFNSLNDLKNNLGVYPLDKNPNITDPDGNASSVNAGNLNRIPAIDLIDEPGSEPLTDVQRMAYDDSRISIFLGRFRNNTFINNEVILADYGFVTIGNQTVGKDLDVATYPYGSDYQNIAYGGAIYISGRSDSEYRRMEVGFGVNNSINIESNGILGYQSDELVTFEDPDTFRAELNQVENRQEHPNSMGAKGGAVYVGSYTSLIVAGQFIGNESLAKYFTEIGTPLDASNYSQGGAIFHANTLGRLQLRGGPARDDVSNPTLFESNTSGAGGAIYVDGNTSNFMSPVIGGTDRLLNTRDYGFNILFRDNRASVHGGAIFTKRNFWVNGAGGVESNQLIGYGGKYPVRFWSNHAGLSGGAIHSEVPDAQVQPINKRNIIIKRASFRNNDVAMNIEENTRKAIRGGGALYVINGDLNVVQGTEFVENVVRNGNGAAIAQVNPRLSSEKFFVSDLDNVTYTDGIATDYTSTNGVFTWADNVNYPADVRMLTRFYENEIILDSDSEFINSQMGNGSTNSITANNRIHGDTDLQENGIGLGGALYILGEVNKDLDRTRDSVHFNRVRIQGNKTYSGPAVYSDNWDLKLIFNRSLITTNEAYSEAGSMQNLIRGPIERDGSGNIEANQASSDLAGAVIFGEVLGPLPSSMYSEAANSIYNNNSRFLIRLPDAPDTKGVLAGTAGIGFGGTDTLRGNYWGKTEVNVRVDVANLIYNDSTQGFYPGAEFETFFVAGDGNTWLPINNSWVAGDDARAQGPHESLQRYTYETVPLRNLDQGLPTYDENTVGDLSIPENLLFSGHIYDIHDKGTDIKSADYSARRMSPIEDFAVGIPPVLKNFDNTALPSNTKYVKRYVRDQYCLEDDRYSDFMAVLQKEYSPDTDGDFYHPIGQPLFLEAEADYDGLVERSNHDMFISNESVFFVINETTGDFIRVNLNQVSEEAPTREVLRGRVDFVPDSTNRIPNTLIRRTTEGLLNFGSGDNLLRALEDNPYNEDNATLLGRKYSHNENSFAGVTNLFSNRPDLPADNNDRATFFAGERYRTLPVNVGDNIRVVSRTKLWQDGVVPAFEQGIEFAISAGIEAPQFTGDIVKLRDTPIIEIRPTEDPNGTDLLDTNEIVEYRNTIFVREDRTYPANDGAYGSQTRDSILSMTAIDSNNYYDPRAILIPSQDKYTYLTYNWSFNANSGLANWMSVDTLFAGDGTTNVKDGAIGYQQFSGQPMNPYVVPGGEDVNVTVYSYPPHFRTIDSLKAEYGWDSDNDTLAKFIELYPSYFHSQSYTDNARYLQQDTIDIGNTANLTFANDYTFKLFVVDSLPRWLDWDYTSETITRNWSDGSPRDIQVVYEPSVRPCFEADARLDEDLTPRRLVANLTDKLRFQVDINTDDELEDEWAARVHNWPFTYGRTAYGFRNTIVSAGDTVIIDDTEYLDENGDPQVQVNQIRPSWLANEYLYEYNSDTDQDVLNQFFTTSGQINARIDRQDALNLLSRETDINGALNLDTTMTVVVNDGHGGKRELEFDILVNVAPEITTTNLDNAKEDERYNPQLLNLDRGIQVADFNFDQEHTFELIYDGDYANGIPKDNCFPEAGNWELGTDYFNDTPDWLLINRTSGLLYGTPRVTDAPRTENVSVLVTDSEGLTAVRVFQLQVDSTNHLPDITAVPSTDCFDIGGEYSDTIKVTDIDLLRDELGFEETLTIEVIEPATGFTVTPSTLTGALADSIQNVVISSTSIPDGFRDEDGKGVIRVRVTDKDGNVIIKEYRLNLSDPVNFVCKLEISNSIGAFEELYWGAASGNNPTTGDGKDGDSEIGKLDTNFCEYELPPLPTVDVFDARWTLPSRNGVARTIYPDGTGLDDTQFFLYKAEFQPGGENGNVSSRYPITVEWDRTCIPSATDTDKNPLGSNWYMWDGFSNGDFFTVEMRTGESKGFETVEINGDMVTLTITNTTINSIIILADIPGDVESDVATVQTAITSVNPNPIDENANIEFVLAEAGNVQIDIVDLFGNVVTTLSNEVYAAGNHNINWDAKSQTGQRLASGYYNVRLVSGGKTSALPVQIVK